MRQQQNDARQLINLWLTVISNLFDHVTADKQTTTSEQCIEYQRERTCHDLIILSQPAPSHASMRLNVAVVVSNRLLYCTRQWTVVLRMFISPTSTAT